MPEIEHFIELIGVWIDVLGVVVIVSGIVIAFGHLLRNTIKHPTVNHYRSFKARIGHALLLGLEILVAADIIKTVALEPVLEDLLILAGLVAIRTFLGWALVLEIEERWPWQTKA